MPTACKTVSTSEGDKAEVAPSSTGYFDKGTRLTISMWSFSWLQANHPGGAYEDLERRVAEARERGYNTFRADCYPSRILEKESAFRRNWTPGVNLPRWGQVAADCSFNVRKKVAELADLCRKHDIWLGLDSWDKAHMFGHANQIAPKDEEREFTRYGEVWAKALKLMREDGVLERAVWIAPMNEVPHFCTRFVKSVQDIRSRPLNEGETQIQKSEGEEAIYRRINDWMAAPIRAEIAREKIPISYSSLGAERYNKRLTDLYDVVDVHFMPNVIETPEYKEAYARASRGNLGGKFRDFEKFDLKEFSRAWDKACRETYPKMLERARDYHQKALSTMTLPSGKKLTAIITESFGPCYWPDHPDVGWDWYKRYNADALRVVAAMDFQGASLSNYAEPIFTLWSDTDWHYTSNAFFRTARI